MPAVAKNIQTWSRTAASNVLANTGFTMDEGMSPSAVNNSVRAIMAALKELHDAFAGAGAWLLTDSSSATNAWTMTAFYTPRDLTNDTNAITAGQVYFGTAPTTPTSSLTLAISGGAAKPVLFNNAAMVSGIVTSGDPFMVWYDGTSQHLVLLNHPLAPFVLSSGKVGLGVTPTYKLHLKGVTGSGTTPSFFIEHPATSNGMLLVTESSGNTLFQLANSGGTVGAQLSATSAGTNTFAADTRLTATPALSTDSMGYRGFGPVNNQTGNYTFVLADAGCMVRQSSGSGNTWTIPPVASVAWPISNTAILLRNATANTVAIARGSGVTLRRQLSGTDANLTLGAWGIGMIAMEASNVWFASGDVS